MATVNARHGKVRRAANAMRRSPDTRALKRELRDGNHYALRLIEARGATWNGGAIVRKIV